MDSTFRQELTNLAVNRIQLAQTFLDSYKNKSEIRKALTEEAEIPGFESTPLKFGQFVRKDFVVMMTDIRRSTDIINSLNGTENMFKIFYSYSALVAKIVDKHSGTSTEFLGDGVLNLFDTDTSKEEAYRCSYRAARDILEARSTILNPIYQQIGAPQINIGIGIDSGETIVTRFGYKGDNDLKAFGKCVYNVSRLCKGFNEILASPESIQDWPTSPNGTLTFISTQDRDGNDAYRLN